MSFGENKALVLLASANVFNVCDPRFAGGAKGDGVTDDTAAIQAAVDALIAINSIADITQDFPAKIQFPCGKYKTTDSVNCTGIKGLSWVIEGNGSFIMAHCAGKPVFDFLHSARYHIHDLGIWGDITDKPSYGIQMGRGVAADDGSSANCFFDNVYIDGYFTRACLYNNAGEQFIAVNNWYTNRYNNADCYVLIMDGRNYENITSAFFTVTIAPGTSQPFTQNTFDHCTFRKGGVGANTGSPILYMGEGGMHRFKECYAVSLDAPIIVTENCLGIQDWHLDIHCEATGCTHFLMIDNVNPASQISFPGLFMKDHGSFCSDAFIDTTGTTRTVVMTGCHLDFGTPVSNTIPIFGPTAGASKLHVNGEIHLKRTAPLDISGAWFTGKLILYTGTTVTHTPGSYDMVQQPDTVDHRITKHKGALRIIGTAEGTDVTEWIQFEGAASGGIPAITTSDGALALPATLTSGGSAVKKAGKETACLPAMAMLPAATNGAEPDQIETPTHKVNIGVLRFDPSTEEYAHFSFRAPKSSNEAAGFIAQFAWSHESTVTNFDAVWGVQFLARSNDEALDTAYGSAAEVTDTGGTAGNQYETAVTASITPGGTWAEGDWLYGRVYRKAAAVADTLAVDALLHGLTLFFTTNAGSDD